MNAEPVAIVDLRPGRCTCGCGTEVPFRFKQGHSSTLKQHLLRALGTNQPVLVKIGQTEVHLPAEQAATYLDGPKAEWSAMLRIIR